MSSNAEALAALSSTSRRARVHDAALPIKLPKAVKLLVEAEAKNQGVTSSDIARTALGEYFEKRGIA